MLFYVYGCDRLLNLEEAEMQITRKEIAIINGDELIRAVLFTSGIPAGAVAVHRGQTIMGTDHCIYHIRLGVVDTLIEHNWVMRRNEDRDDYYVFSYDRMDEWLAAEDARMLKAREVLGDRYSGVEFEKTCEWSVLTHPHSADFDSRGFVFKDTNGYEYLVCEGGRVMHLPLKLVAL